MWHETMDTGLGANDQSPESAIRLQRMGAAVDEIVAALAVLAVIDGPRNPQHYRRLAAASRRLWLLASRPAGPRAR